MLLDSEAERMLAEGRNTLSGEEAFKLYDTYGVPFDMVEDILAGKGLKVDRPGFDKQMQQQRERARTGVSKVVFAHEGLQGVVDRAGATEFLGYEKMRAKAVVRALMTGDEPVKSAGKGTEVTVILDRTPFYGEAGGQIGDTGTIKSKSFEIEITDTGRHGEAIIHAGKVKRGEVSVEDEADCIVNKDRRRAVARSHTATHLLHHALRETLGRHVRQSGSLVEPDRLRFDLTHPTAITDEEEALIERGVNSLVMRDDPVRTRETTMEEALSSGAIALFGEKYGDFVRVVSAGRYSRELCGGTHCKRTGEIGLFRIVKEEAIASGVRRIEALTGQRALEETVKDRGLIAAAGDRLGVPKENILDRMDSLSAEVKTLRQDKARFQQSTLKDEADRLLAKKTDVAGAVLVSGVVPETDMDGLRKTADFVRDALKDDAKRAAVALGSELSGKAVFVCTMGEDLVKAGMSAGAISKAVSPVIQGGGGGKPNMAQAGGKLGKKIGDAVEQAAEEIRKDLESKRK
jgi:alanyl-tRNA synthetase